MATGDLTAAIRTDGWSADVTIEGRAAWLGAAAFDFGTPGTTAASKFYLSVTSEGYSSAGVLGTIARTVYGTTQVRLPTGSKAIPGTISAALTDGETLTQAVTGATCVVFGAGQDGTHAAAITHTHAGSPDASNVWTGGTSGNTVTPSGAPAARTNDERVVGTDLVVRVALSSDIYNDDKNGGAGTSGTNPTLTASAGWASSGGNNSNAAAAVAVTNNSTLDYPVAFGQWDWVAGTAHRARVKTAFRVAFNARHGHGIAAVRFTRTGASSGALADEYVTSETRTLRTGTNLYGWSHQSASLALTGATQGELITSRVRVYPKVGDADSVQDTNARTTGTDEILGYNEHVVTVDKTDALDVIRYVSTTGNDTTGDGTSGNPWLTVEKAIRTATVNVVKLMGAATTYNLALGGARRTMTEWLVVEPDTGATPTVVMVSDSAAARQYNIERLCFRNLTVSKEDNNSYLNGNNTGNWLWFDDCTFDDGAFGAGANPSFGYQSNGCYLTNCSGDLDQWGMTGFSTSRVAYSYDGCTNPSGIANRITSCSGDGVGFLGQKTSGNPAPSQNNLLFDYNKFINSVFASGNLIILKDYALTGISVVGNVIEKSSGTGAAVHLWGDNASTANTATHVIVAHNTSPIATDACRWNCFYNDTTTNNPAYRHVFMYGNDIGRFNIKTDTFTTANAARINNWPVYYGVNCPDNNFDTDSGSGSFVQAYPGLRHTTATALYADSGSDDFSPDTGSTVLDRIDYSGTVLVPGDQAGNYCSRDTTALASLGALQPTPTLAVTVDGDAAAEDATVNLGQQSSGASIDVVATVSGLTGATVYIEDYATDAGIAEVAEFVPEYITVGGTTTNTATLRLEQGTSTAAITLTSSYGDGDFDFDITWEEQLTGAVRRGRYRRGRERRAS